MMIDLVIDAALPPGHEPRYATLERLVARGEAFAFEARDLHSALRMLFDLPGAEPLPAAALSLLGEGIDPGRDGWLRLDPVHVRAERARLLLVPVPRGDIALQEADALRAALAPHLAQTGHELVASPSGLWYVRVPGDDLALRTRPPPQGPQPLAHDDLPAGPDGAQWRRFFAEAQMLLHDLPVNEAREASGKLAVNAVWPWGQGRMIAIAPGRYSLAASDDPVVRGIARAAGTYTEALPHDAARMLAALAPGARVLIACTHAELASVERDWARPLAEALARRRVQELRLFLLGANATLARRVTRRELRRFWRRARALAHA